MSESGDSRPGQNENGPLDISSELKLAESLQNQGQLERAKFLYEQILSVDADNFTAIHQLGVIENQTNNFETALNYFQTALKLNPRSVLAQLNIAITLGDLNRLDEALFHYQYVLSFSPNNADALWNSALLFHKLNRPEEALSRLDKLISFDPNHVGALLARGNSLFGLGRFEEAFENYKQALNINPEDPDALNVRSFALQNLPRPLEFSSLGTPPRNFQEPPAPPLGSGHQDNSINTESNTIIIPTKNRFSKLFAYLAYLNSNCVHFRLLILESGTIYPELEPLFPSLRLTHIRCDESMSPIEKIADGLTRVSSEFVSLCTDDDITTWQGIQESVEFLATHPDFSACQGYHARFSIENTVFNLVNVQFYTPPLDEPIAEQRLINLMLHYEPICWATFRASSLRRTFDIVRQTQGLLFQELAWSSHTALEGRVQRLPLIYCWRRVDDTQLAGHPLFALIEDPFKFTTQYHSFHNVLADRLENNGEIPPPAIMRTIDLIFWRQFLREVDMKVINDFTRAVLLQPDASVSDPDIENRIKPASPQVDSGWKAEMARGDRTYRWFANLLDPKPYDQIHLPWASFEYLLADLDRYPLDEAGSSQP